MVLNITVVHDTNIVFTLGYPVHALIVVKDFREPCSQYLCSVLEHLINDSLPVLKGKGGGRI